jgi:GxxExxY protein
LAHELTLRGLRFDRQRPVPVSYKGILVESAYRLDLVVENEIILEIKAVDRLLPVHEAQVITYLKHSVSNLVCSSISIPRRSRPACVG